MQPCLTTVSATHGGRHDQLQRRPAHRSATAPPTSPATAPAAGGRTVLIDNNPPAHPRAVDARRRRGLAADQRLRPRLGEPRPGAGEPDRRRLLADHRRRRLRHRRPVRRRPRPPRPRRPLACPPPAPTRCSCGCATRRGTRRRASAVTVPLRFDDVQPAGRLRGRGAGGAGAGGRSPTSTPGPASGADPLPPRRRASAGPSCRPSSSPATPGAADLVAPMPELGLGTFVFRADAADAAGNTASTTLRADGTQMAIRRVPPPPVAGAGPRASRGSSPRLRGGHGRGDSLTVPFGAPALLSGRLDPGRRRRPRRPRAAGRLPPLARRARCRPRRRPCGPASRAASSCGSPPGPSRRVTVAFAGDGGLEEPARRPALELRVRSGVSLRAVPRTLRTGQAVRLGGRVRSRGAPIPRRGKLVAIQYLEAGDPPLAPGPRHPQRPPRPLPRPLPLPLRQRAGGDPAAGDGPGGGALALRARLLAAGHGPGPG